MNSSILLLLHWISKLPSNYDLPFDEENSECIVAHVRMGDRHLTTTSHQNLFPHQYDGDEDMNMIQWCQNHTNTSNPTHPTYQGTWIDGNSLGFNQWSNMGCNHRLPFGGITLDHIINASIVLSDYQQMISKSNEFINLIIITDDHKWLNR
jgi:hypothetical protein